MRSSRLDRNHRSAPRRGRQGETAGGMPIARPPALAPGVADAMMPVGAGRGPCRHPRGRRTALGLIVQKFGGTSVANAERIMAAARRAIRAKQAGNQVLVVVSAQGDT